jgi:MFS family permease
VIDEPLTDSSTATKSEPSSKFRLSTFSSLRHRNYRYLFASTFMASGGNWIQQITLSWLAWDMTDSALIVGAVTASRGLPSLITSPLGGVLSDRMDRRQLILVIQVVLGVLALGFAFLVSSGHLQVWHLFVFTFISGAGWTMNNPVRQSLVPDTVPREDLMNAVALNSAAFQLFRIIGVVLGGWLIAFTGPSTNFMIQGIAYIFMAALILQIHVPKRDYLESKKESLLENFKGGVNYVRSQEVTLALILLGMVPALFVMPFINALLPVFNDEVLGNGPEGFGLLMGMYAAGAMLGTFVLASLQNFPHKGKLLVGAAIASGITLVALAFTSWGPLSMFVLFLSGAAHMMYMATNNTLIQLNTPPEFRGRVLSLFFLDHALTPLGSLFAGYIAWQYGSPVAFFVGGTIASSMVIFMAFKFRALRGTRV